MEPGFEAAATAAADAGENSFTYNGTIYAISTSEDGGNAAFALGIPTPVLVSTQYYYVMQQSGTSLSDEFRVNSLLAIAEGKDFSADGISYTVGEVDGLPAIYDAAGNLYAELSTFVIRRYDGTDTMAYDLKMAILESIYQMEEED